jgi:hypothetical protein
VASSAEWLVRELALVSWLHEKGWRNAAEHTHRRRAQDRPATEVTEKPQCGRLYAGWMAGEWPT